MKSRSKLLSDPNYNPDRLLNELLSRLRLKNDAALSRALDITPSVLSKLRHRRLAVAAELIIRIHDITMLSIDDIRLLMGCPARRPCCG